MLRILAFDIGERRIGVAVSDPLGITAQGIETYTRTDDLQKDVAYLLSLANGYRPVKLVFGMPRNMDGSYGMQAEYTKAFAEEVLKGWDGDSVRATTRRRRPAGRSPPTATALWSPRGAGSSSWRNSTTHGGAMPVFTRNWWVSVPATTLTWPLSPAARTPRAAAWRWP
mgnify:CR=1 FL=1